MKEHLICVPVCERSGRDLATAMARAAEEGDVTELRLDCLDEGQLQAAAPEIFSAISKGDRCFIITFRPSEGGGAHPLSLAKRFEFILEKRKDGWQRGSTLWDVELDLAHVIKNSERYSGSLCDWERTICSHHDFAKTPENIGLIYKSLAGTPARILKIAVQANEITDCIPVFNLLEQAQRSGREMIAIAMGSAGIATRILGPSRGAFLTYAALDDAHATAPGQISVSQLLDLYRIGSLNGDTEITGLMGLPVSHSVSPHILNAAFAARSVNAVYIPLEVKDAGRFLKRMVDPRTREIDWNLRGLSVTAPHKREVIQYLDWIEPSASEIGAVNTIEIKNDQLFGYNTDANAFLSPLRKRFGTLAGKVCAIIGAGGAARAALWGLKHEGTDITIFARRPDAARLLAEEFGAGCADLSSGSLKSFDVVINATPAGSLGSGDPSPIVSMAQLKGATLAYDLVYNPLETSFLREAAKAGCETIGGLQMLVAQAAAQFELWTGQDAPFDLMYDTAERALAPQAQMTQTL